MVWNKSFDESVIIPLAALAALVSLIAIILLDRLVIVAYPVVPNQSVGFGFY